MDIYINLCGVFMLYHLFLFISAVIIISFYHIKLLRKQTVVWIFSSHFLKTFLQRHPFYRLHFALLKPELVYIYRLIIEIHMTDLMITERSAIKNLLTVSFMERSAPPPSLLYQVLHKAL